GGARVRADRLPHRARPSSGGGLVHGRHAREHPRLGRPRGNVLAAGERRARAHEPRDPHAAADAVTAAPLLSISDLRVGVRRRGGTQTIVRGVNLDVVAGEKLAIVGESGSGKTLTMLSLLRLLPKPLEVLGGSVRYAGE